MPEFQTLYALAEIAVAIAGFAAIVVLFRRSNDGAWDASDADRFNGMLLHAVSAGFFCILPPFTWVFVSEPSLVWQVGSTALGLQLLVHSAVIFWLPSSGPVVRALLLVPVGLAVLQLLNLLEISFSAEFRPYLAGVLWHIFQAGLLFVMLIWVRAEHTKRPG